MRAMWVFVALVLVSGCAVQKDWIDRTLVTVDVTGVWEGTFEGTGGSGGVRFVLQQQGPKVTGEMKIPAVPAVPTVPSGPLGVRPPRACRPAGSRPRGDYRLRGP